MTCMNTSQQSVTERFSRIAARYDEFSAIPVEVGERLIERLDGLSFQPQRILDLGCGTGTHSLALKKRFPDADVVALDRAREMLEQAGKHQGWWKKRFERVVGDAMRLPLAQSTFDLVHANLVLHWCEDREAVLANLRRVLRPGGLALLSCLGPDSFRELRQAGVAGEVCPITGAQLADVQRLGSALTHAGFAEPVLDTDWLKATYSSEDALLAELETLGAIQANRPIDINRPAGHDDEALALTWEIVSASAWCPEEGQPIRTHQGEEASIPVSSLKVRKR